MSAEKIIQEVVNKIKSAFNPKYIVTYPDSLGGVNIQSGLTSEEAKNIEAKHSDVKIYPQ